MEFNHTCLYAKGTAEIAHFDPLSGDLLYFTDKIQTNQIKGSVNLGEIKDGIGNVVDIQLPDSAALAIEYTAGDFSLEGRALNVGQSVSYNGIAEMTEAVVGASNKLTLTQTPVAPYGSSDIVCYINKGGTAYKVDATTKEVQDFVATTGTTYYVRYYYNNASAKLLTVDALFAPAVTRCLIKIPVFSKTGTQSAMAGSRWGTLLISIPRHQFNGDPSVIGDQTNPATTVMNGKALAYDPTEGSAAWASASTPKLAYMVLVPDGDVAALAVGLAVVGGAITVAASATKACPVKYVMDNEQLVQPSLADLTYVITDTSKATVSALGIITGVAAGSTEITITKGSLSTVANLTVTA